MVNRMRLLSLGVVGVLGACQLAESEVRDPKVLITPEWVKAQGEMGDVVPVGDIYKKALERAKGEFTKENLTERLNALDKAIESERLIE